MDKVAIRPLKNPILGTPVGKKLEVSRREARILVAVGRAEYADADPLAGPMPAALPVPEPTPVAEKPKAEKLQAKVETVEKDEDEPTKRTYKRRDLTAEPE